MIKLINLLNRKIRIKRAKQEQEEMMSQIAELWYSF